ncbi:SURF4 family-domain-containing protein, partial [Suillus ampliporus]
SIEIYSQPLKPHLPAVGRFLIIVTFYEDALKIMTQCSDQLWCLQVSTMLGVSTAVIMKRHTEYAVIGLLSVVVIQGFGYGLIIDLTFFLQNLSVIGRLVMVFSETMINKKKSFAGIPSMSETDRKK